MSNCHILSYCSIHSHVQRGNEEKIRQNLSNLYIRVSTAVHSEVSAEEAKSLFLNTYLILGEILHIEQTVSSKTS